MNGLEVAWIRAAGRAALASVTVVDSVRGILSPSVGQCERRGFGILIDGYARQGCQKQRSRWNSFQKSGVAGDSPGEVNPDRDATTNSSQAGREPSPGTRAIETDGDTAAAATQQARVGADPEFEPCDTALAFKRLRNCLARGRLNSCRDSVNRVGC